ncbi:MAG: Holliday junction branch migration protein RuvA [Acetobacteraceae bacterium]
MIASLTGRIASTEERSCIIDVAGVGYLVHASSRTLARLPAPPDLAHVLVETELRPDAILLYGFADASERAWFRLLTAVQGVGAKLALAILSTLPPGDLSAAIATGDRAWLMRAPGVGAKLAQRLLGELRDPAARLPTLSQAVPAASGVATDAISALVNLGYRRTEVEAALSRAGARLGEAPPFATLIREGLKELAR